MEEEIKKEMQSISTFRLVADVILCLLILIIAIFLISAKYNTEKFVEECHHLRKQMNEFEDYIKILTIEKESMRKEALRNAIDDFELKRNSPEDSMDTVLDSNDIPIDCRKFAENMEKDRKSNISKWRDLSDLLLEKVKTGMEDNGEEDLRRKIKRLREEIERLKKEIARLLELIPDPDSGEGDIKISVGEDTLNFESGQAVPYNTKETRIAEQKIMKRVLTMVRKKYNIIQVEGHTDNVPTGGSGGYPTNWELSEARALYLAKKIDKFLNAKGYKRKKHYLVVATGFGEFLPVIEQKEIASCKENRRIEIIFLKRNIEKYIRGNR